MDSNGIVRPIIIVIKKQILCKITHLARFLNIAGDEVNFITNNGSNYRLYKALFSKAVVV
jgi:hypothetical protein